MKLAVLTLVSLAPLFSAHALTCRSNGNVLTYTCSSATRQVNIESVRIKGVPADCEQGISRNARFNANGKSFAILVNCGASASTDVNFSFDSCRCN